MQKYIKGLKIFSLFALACTVILWIGLWISSAVPSEKSGAATDKVANVVDSALNLTDKFTETVTQAISMASSIKQDYFYVEEHPQLIVSFIPKDTTDTDVIFYVDGVDPESPEDNPNAKIDENGVITFSGIGSVTFCATLKSNPEVECSLQLECIGEDPLNEDYPERMSLCVRSSKNSPNLTSLTVGERKKLYLNEGKTSLTLGNISIEDTSILGFYGGYVYPRKEGSTTIKYSLKRNGVKHVVSLPIVVEAGSLSEIAPFKAKDNIEIYQYEKINKFSLLDLPEDADLSWYECRVVISDKSIAVQSGSKYIKTKLPGQITITLSSLFFPDNSVTIDVDVKKKIPETLKVYGAKTIMPNSNIQYRSSTKPIDYVEDVVWTVVQGKATISETGVLRASSYGKIVIRCQSTLNPELYVEKEINSVLYTSPYMFVRKLMGHAGLSALLGFGLFGSLLLICCKKWMCALSVPLSFVYAGISELIQKFTPGRYCLMSDVLVDFVGALVGIAIGILLFTVVSLLWRLINKKSFEKIKDAFFLQSVKLIFKPTKNISKEFIPVEPQD